MNRVEVQKIPIKPFKADELLARLCFYYPQYTLTQAKKLPFKHVRMLINQAERLKAMDYYNLVQIAAAPHTDRGKGVKTLSDHFKAIANE